jgi:YggT family protein
MGVAANFTLLSGDFVRGPLGDTISSVETFVHVFIVLYSIVLIAYILMSWVRLPYSPMLNRIQRFLHDVSEPYLRLFRRLLPMAGGFDFSPIIAFLALGIIDQLVTRILNRFH